MTGRVPFPGLYFVTEPGKTHYDINVFHLVWHLEGVDTTAPFRPLCNPGEFENKRLVQAEHERVRGGRVCEGCLMRLPDDYSVEDYTPAAVDATATS